MNVTAKLGLDFRPGFRLSFGGPQRCLGGVVSGPAQQLGRDDAVEPTRIYLFKLLSQVR